MLAGPNPKKRKVNEVSNLEKTQVIDTSSANQEQLDGYVLMLQQA
jgi:hypothetical protein